ncbi:MAG TPA: hypothetical protein VER11_17555 [Polyangiaceae bacterium]|nr:hypothetical protein [Polyangiaceae bacterium]
MRSKTTTHSRKSTRLSRPLSEPTTTLSSSSRALFTAALAAVALSAACGSDSKSGAGTAGTGAVNPPSGAGTGTTAAAGTGSTPAPGAGGTPSGAGGASNSTAGGPSGATSGAGGTVTAAGGSGGGDFVVPPISNSDHCLYGYSALPSDNTMASGFVKYSTPGGDDTTLQPEVLQWMSDNKWTGAHVIWHAVRGCKDGTAVGLLGPLGLSNSLCKDHPEIVPADQNCKTAGDGYQFLLFHRHMLQSLKALWPKHAADFAGFPKWPTTAAEVPNVFAAPKWSQTVLDAAAIGDNIDKPENLAKFPSEGALGHWLQCNVGAMKLAGAPDEPYIGLHFNLHDQWARTGGTHSLNDGQVNVTNYMFWKLHGWIDNVWEKYRVAKGITADPAAMQKYNQDLKQSCNEMDIAEAILKQTGGNVKLDCPPDVNESGDFHTKVRPIFETATNHCASCHGPTQTSPYANLTLGGQVSSKCIVQRLKGGSLDGGQFPLVVAGDPDKSWLYLKASGKSETAGCVSSDMDRPCNNAAMPPSGKTMTDAELKILYDWIKAGAAGPP